jgi:hypothetical protein
MTTNIDLYMSYTEQAGKLCRQLALVGAGLIWLFHGSVVGSGNVLFSPLNPGLIWSLGLICFSLTIDILQYSIGSIFWYKKASANGVGAAKDATCLISFANWCIGLKLASMFISYACLGLFLLKTPFL